jgi:hypothetical protein
MAGVHAGLRLLNVESRHRECELINYIARGRTSPLYTRIER